MKKLGIDTSKIRANDTVKNLIERLNNNFDCQESIENEGISLNYKIGKAVSGIIRINQGKQKGNKPTEDQIKTLKDEYGISITEGLERRDTSQEFIEILDVLKRNGIPTDNILKRDTIQSLVERAGFSDFEALKRDGVDLKYKIGHKKQYMTQVYRGSMAGAPPTEEQVRILKEEYGISFEKKPIQTQDIGKATFDADTQTCAEASTIINGLINEKQKTRE